MGTPYGQPGPEGQPTMSGPMGGVPPYPGGMPPVQVAIPVMAAPPAKWRALRTIATIFKVFAWIAGGIGALGALATLFAGSQLGSTGAAGGAFVGLFELIGAGIAFLSLYGYAELILLLISIEENTRLRRF